MTQQNDTTIPVGYCQCGCGQRTPLARKSRSDNGQIKGQPLRYIQGHNRNRNKPGRFVCERCGRRFRGSLSRPNRYCSRACADQPPSLIPDAGDPSIMHVPLTRGMTATIDASDAALVRGRNWCALKTKYHTYAYQSNDQVLLHRLIVGVTDPHLVVDHINRNGLDCRRANLRISTQSQNLANAKKRVGKNPYKGVCRMSSKSTRWVATITHNYRSIYLGSFDTPEAAAHAYDLKARELFGPFARLNFPEDD